MHAQGEAWHLLWGSCCNSMLLLLNAGLTLCDGNPSNTQCHENRCRVIRIWAHLNASVPETALQELTTSCVQGEMPYTNTSALFCTDRLLCFKEQAISGLAKNESCVANPQISSRRHSLLVPVLCFTQLMQVFMALCWQSLSFAIPVPCGWLHKPIKEEYLKNSFWNMFDAKKFSFFFFSFLIKKHLVFRLLCMFEGAVVFHVKFFSTRSGLVKVLQALNGFWETAPTFMLFGYFVFAFQSSLESP